MFRNDVTTAARARLAGHKFELPLDHRSQGVLMPLKELERLSGFELLEESHEETVVSTGGGSQ